MFPSIEHEVDFCVVGGGLAGLCAAVAAARHGARVAIMQDRPVFGGNASSEIRMWVCGAGGENRRETGIIEELQLENLHRNPNKAYSLWDSVLFGAVAEEENITSIMNCSCMDAAVDGSRIRSVTGWQLTTQTYHTVHAGTFADCSGDSILIPLTGAEYRVGREGQEEFGESIAPPTADHRVMGMSCLLQVRETDQPVHFKAPEWATYYGSREDFPYRDIDPRETNFWWIELGGEEDNVADTERIKQRLLASALGIWDFIKNRSGIDGVDRLDIDFIGFLPGKRESRRYVGDHIITQNDVSSRGRFEDIVAYGGWSMDDHHPAGLEHPGHPTVFHEAPSPWGIPLRALYSRNIANLYCAGRNISATHVALASSRVMRTCAIIGQAVGTAASIGAEENLDPRGVYEHRLSELQQRLMDDDCWLPGKSRDPSALTNQASLEADQGDPEALRNGIDRPTEKYPEDALRAIIRPPDEGGPAATTPPDIEWVDNAWVTRVGSSVVFRWPEPQTVEGLRIVFDSNLNRYYRDMRMLFGYFKDYEPKGPPAEMIRAFSIEYLDTENEWTEVVRVTDNAQRLVRGRFEPVETTAIRLKLIDSWGNRSVRVFAADVLGATPV